MLTTEQIARACAARVEDAARFTSPLNAAMVRYYIDNPKRQAAFLATVAIESAHLTTTKENLFYRDPARLVSIYPRAFKNVAEAEPFARNPKALGEKLYNGYFGRGLIQLTWQANYIAAGDALGFDYVRNPELVEQPEHAALTAAWFWDSQNCNPLADRDDMNEITRRVNGPRRMHLTERTQMAQRTLTWLA